MLNKFKRPLLYVSGGCLFLLIIYFVFKPTGEILNEKGFSQIVSDRNGEVLRITLSEDEKYRIYTHLNSAGSLIKETILLKEDKYFYYHPGVNPISLFNAFYQTYIHGQRKIGGSTITMQLARLLYNLKTKTIWGKTKQIFYALYFELYYSKNDILEAYLNIAPCGGNIEGFAAASQIFFSKNLIDLTLHEALFLSVLPQNPSSYHPKAQTVNNNLVDARKRLYKLWIKEHSEHINNSVHIDMPINVQYHVPFNAPHYSVSLLEKYKDEQKIHGTLDLKLQNIISSLTKRYIQRKTILGVKNAAVLLVDSDNMQILASLGSADFYNDEIEGQVNGTKARRSPGSTLKPFVYALAMEQGLIHPMTMLKDAPTSFSEYSPDNYERDFKGPMKAWKALVTSRNIPAVSLASRLKERDLYDFLYKTGAGDLKSKIHYGLSIVLGSAEFSMEELVEFYGILANNGSYRKIIDSFDAESKLLDKQKELLSEEVCFLIKRILRKNPKPSALQVPVNNYEKKPVAYKTGTSIGFKDSWSIGIFDHYILAVWLGNFNGYGNPSFNGRYLATPLMFEIIDSILPEIGSPEEYDELENLLPTIVRTDICDVSGQIAHPHCSRKVPTLYIPGKSPITKCEICREIYVDSRTGYRTFKKKGKHIKKEVYEFWPTDLLLLFRRAGIPRKVPPPFDPKENFEMISATGTSPEIVSPLKDTKYMLQQGEDTFNNLPLKGIFDADVKEVYWFVDEKYIGKANPNLTQYWSLKPGVFQIGVVDDHGRSDSRRINIGIASN
ncbi:MAG: penicillin-binding protein 1C [Bacteroidota bacterium]